MAHDTQHLERLARDLADLEPEERAHVVAEADRLSAPRSPKKRFTVPKLSGGVSWVGGDLHREDIYGEDGR